MVKNLIEEYFDYQKFYEEKYGKNTIIAMEVGSFFEFYGVDNSEEKIGKVKEISEILNIQITRRSKAIKENSRKNPLMAGIPTVSFKRYLNILLKLNQYTIVLIEQFDQNPKTKAFKRKVTEILSPGTNFNTNSSEANNLISVFIQEEYEDNFSIGASCIDLSTGKNIIFETNSIINDNLLPFNDLERFINSNSPKEIIINLSLNKKNKEGILKLLNLNNTVFHINENIKKDYLNINYQEDLLKNIFENNTSLSSIENLDLENLNSGRNSYILLLLFAYEHNTNIIKRLDKPSIWEEHEYLKLSNNAIYQLNLVNQNDSMNTYKLDSIFSLIDNTSTSLGKRLLKYQLLNPIKNSSILSQRYNYIEKMKPNYKEFESHLNKIYDIERLQRKILLNKLNPAELYMLFQSYSSSNELIDLTNEKFKTFEIHSNLKNELSDFIKQLENDFLIEELMKHNLSDINGNFFQKNINENIDNINNEIIEYKNNFLDILTQLNNKYKEKLNIPSSKEIQDIFKLEKTDKEGFYLFITNSKYKDFFKNINEEEVLIELNYLNEKYEYNLSNLTIKNFTNNKKITFDIFNTISEKLLYLENKLFSIIKEEYLKKLEEYSIKYKTLFINIRDFISNIDVIKSNAKTALLNNYIKPELVLKEDRESFVDIKDLRHPLIEKIEKTGYITNDIQLGKDFDQNTMLLFGLNASGKSSLLKALGINVILAQSGMYVAATSFKYNIFDKLFTRILSQDNLFKSESSFQHEMNELKSILKGIKNNPNVLTLTDELTRGTETTSGLAISASTLIEFSKENTKGIFTTHLHELNSIEEINELNNVKSFHLKVFYDDINDLLIYDRKLDKGNGSSIYGLEVAKSIGLDKDFINRSYKIRNKIIKYKEKTEYEMLMTEDYKKSNYNKNVIMKKCIFCEEKAEHTHHILEQINSSEEGFIENKHKNDSHNLLPICEKHHFLIHKIVAKDKTLEGENGIKWLKTSTGKKLWVNPILKEKLNIDIKNKNDIISF